MLSPVKIWRNQNKVKQLLGQKGKILTFTKVHVPPSGFELQAPYAVVIVRLANGKKYTAQLIDWSEEELKIGQMVISVLRKTKDPGMEGVIPYGIKFRPVA